MFETTLWVSMSIQLFNGNFDDPLGFTKHPVGWPWLRAFFRWPVLLLLLLLLLLLFGLLLGGADYKLKKRL